MDTKCLISDQVMHPAERESGLIAGLELSAAYSVTISAIFMQRSGQQRQRTQRSRMIVQLSDWSANPTDQPDVEFVVGVQPSAPVGPTAGPGEGQQVVKPPPENSFGIPVGGVKQIRESKPSRWLRSGR